jgi:hypothetical protein
VVVLPLVFLVLPLTLVLFPLVLFLGGRHPEGWIWRNLDLHPRHLERTDRRQLAFMIQRMLHYLVVAVSRANPGGAPDLMHSAAAESCPFEGFSRGEEGISTA